MNIRFLEIKNILSIADCRLDYCDSGMTLVEGWNYDDDSANGAGKTAIFNAQSFGLYGKFPRKISVSEMLRQGTKAGYVHVGVQVGIDLVEVKRSRPNKVEFFVNGQPQDMTQTEFESKIGLTYNQYLISMYSAQADAEKFIALNDTDKKNFILQLMDLERFSDYKKGC